MLTAEVWGSTNTLITYDQTFSKVKHWLSTVFIHVLVLVYFQLWERKGFPSPGAKKNCSSHKSLSLSVPRESHTKKGSVSKRGQRKSELVSGHYDTWLPLSDQSGERCHSVQTRGTTETWNRAVRGMVAVSEYEPEWLPKECSARWTRVCGMNEKQHPWANKVRHGKEWGQKGEETEDIWRNEKRVNGLCVCVCTLVCGGGKQGREEQQWGRALDGLEVNRPALDVADGGGRGTGEDTRDPKQQTCQEMKGRIKGDSGSLLFGGEGASKRGGGGPNQGKSPGRVASKIAALRSNSLDWSSPHAFYWLCDLEQVTQLLSASISCIFFNGLLWEASNLTQSQHFIEDVLFSRITRRANKKISWNFNKSKQRNQRRGITDSTKHSSSCCIEVTANKK